MVSLGMFLQLEACLLMMSQAYKLRFPHPTRVLGGQLNITIRERIRFLFDNEPERIWTIKELIKEGNTLWPLDKPKLRPGAVARYCMMMYREGIVYKIPSLQDTRQTLYKRRIELWKTSTSKNN